MIAIPVDSATPGVTSSKLFGNAPIFAIYQPEEDQFFFVRNPEAGNGVKTAEQLKKWEVENVVYSFLGDGPFNAMQRDGIAVYYIGSEPMPLFEIVEQFNQGAFVKVDASNAETYLDPGTPSGSCQCGCTH